MLFNQLIRRNTIASGYLKRDDPVVYSNDFQSAAINAILEYYSEISSLMYRYSFESDDKNSNLF